MAHSLHGNLVTLLGLDGARLREMFDLDLKRRGRAKADEGESEELGDKMDHSDLSEVRIWRERCQVVPAEKRSGGVEGRSRARRISPRVTLRH